MATALMAWLLRYVNMFSRERREKEALRKELAEQRRRADKVERRVETLLEMMELLKQIADNTAPR